MITYNVSKELIQKTNKSPGKVYYEGTCLSTDTKPNKASTNGKLSNGSKLLEIDTSTLYVYDEQNDTWRAWE